MPRRDQAAEDEEYAQALQAEYRKDFLRRQANKNKKKSGGNYAGGRSNDGDLEVGLNDWCAPAISGTMTKNPNTKNNKNSGSSRSRGRSRSGGGGRDETGADITGKQKEKERGRRRRSSTGGANKSNRETESKQRRSGIKTGGSGKKKKSDEARPQISADERLARRHRSRSGGSRDSGESFTRVDASGQVSGRARGANIPSSSLTGDDWLAMYHEPVQPLPAVVAIPPPAFPLEISAPYVASRASSNTPAFSGTSQPQPASDEEYARMVQAQFEREDRAAAGAAAAAAPGRSPAGSLPSQFADASPHFLHERSSEKSYSAASTAPSTDDEAIARRVQQELNDAELAQRLSAQEQQEFASRDVVVSLERQAQLQALEEPPPQKSLFVRCLPLATCVAIAVTIPLLFYFDVFNPSDIPFIGDIFDNDWIAGDPWSGNNMTIIDVGGTPVPQLPDRPMGWNNNGNGLELEILNACNDEYQQYVQSAVANWEMGYPIDSLTLPMSGVPYESECTSVPGKLKICNADYGDTRWRGLNEVLLRGRGSTIFSSVAKLNEYYLRHEGYAQRLYTACHELGHGFGLPHWDENFFNKDLGNCMDYTNNPGGSSQPDESNFLYLAQLYGGRDAATGVSIPAEDVLATALSEYGNNDENNDSSLGTRKLRRTLLDSQEQPSFNHDIPLRHSRVLDEDGYLLSGEDGGDDSRRQRQKRRILQADESREVHVFPSTEYPGYIVIQHFLLVPDVVMSTQQVRRHRPTP